MTNDDGTTSDTRDAGSKTTGYGRIPLLSIGVLTAVGALTAAIGMTYATMYADHVGAGAAATGGQTVRPPNATTPAVPESSVAPQVSAASGAASPGAPSARPFPQPTRILSSQKAVSSQVTGQTRSESYVVQKGDTLEGISVASQVPIDQLARTNGIDDPSNLAVGKVLLFTVPAK